MSFEGKVALVTGSSRGIGKETALELARQGADVIVTYNQKEERAENIAQEIKAMGRKASIHQLDIGNRGSIRSLFFKVKEEFGKLDILINNAANFRALFESKAERLEELADEVIDQILEINIKGPLFCIKEALPLMNRGGKIINISSIVSQKYIPGLSLYSGCKKFLDGLSGGLALELIKRGIKVHNLSPGIVRTASHFAISKIVNLSQEEETMEEMTGKKVLSPEEIAKIVAWFCTEDADILIGHNIPLDGGLSLI